MADKVCYICNSDRFVDDHHYDCRGGAVSPETVPLCRRCHRTYHDWGIGAFSPDTTAKALEVENKRREIFNLLPMKPEDVKRSGYWYRKWGICPTGPRASRREGLKIPFKMPNGSPLCGEDWLKAHLTDYTPEEIGALAIEIGCDSELLSTVSVADKRGAVRAVMKGVHA